MLETQREHQIKPRLPITNESYATIGDDNKIDFDVIIEATGNATILRRFHISDR
jgi:hypothetical protein